MIFVHLLVVVKLEGGTDEDVAALQDEKIDDESVVDVKKATPRYCSQKSFSGLELPHSCCFTLLKFAILEK